VERVSADEFAAAELAWRALDRRTRRGIASGLRHGRLPSDPHLRTVLRTYAYASVWREVPESKGLDLGLRVVGAAWAGVIGADGEVFAMTTTREKRLVRRALRLFLDDPGLTPG